MERGPFCSFQRLAGIKCASCPRSYPFESKPNHARSPQNEAPTWCSRQLSSTCAQPPLPTVLLSDPPLWFPVRYIGDLAGFNEQRMLLPGRPTSACNTCRRKKVKVSTAYRLNSSRALIAIVRSKGTELSAVFEQRFAVRRLCREHRACCSFLLVF